MAHLVAGAFMPIGWDKTFGEVSDEEKNKVSNRGQAFRELKEFLLSGEIKLA